MAVGEEGPLDPFDNLVGQRFAGIGVDAIERNDKFRPDHSRQEPPLAAKLDDQRFDPLGHGFEQNVARPPPERHIDHVETGKSDK